MKLKIMNGNLKGKVMSMPHPCVSVRSPKLYEFGDATILQFPKGSIMPHGVSVGDFFEVEWILDD